MDPWPNDFVADLDAALGEQILDISVAAGEELCGNLDDGVIRRRTWVECW